MGCPFQGCLLSTLIPDIGHWLAQDKGASQRYKMGSSYRFPTDLIFLQIIKIMFYFMDSIFCSVYKHVGKLRLSEFTSFGFCLLVFFFFYWRIIALQGCVDFFHTALQISHSIYMSVCVCVCIYIYIYNIYIYIYKYIYIYIYIYIYPLPLDPPSHSLPPILPL